MLYNQSLPLSRAVGARNQEALTLNNIGWLLSNQKQPAQAIIFFKQSVNTYETLRADIKGLPKDVQDTYTKTIAYTYRNLADLLLNQDRILEAQQVLDLLKVQELDDYLRGIRGTNQRIAFSKSEQTFLDKFNTAQTPIIKLSKELNQLNTTARTAPLNPTQENRRRELYTLLDTLNQDFIEKFLNRDDIKALIAELQRSTPTETLNLGASATLDRLLTQHNALLLYPLILDDGLELVIKTANTPPLRRSVSIKREDLNKTILAFRTALQTKTDSTQLSQQLYDWLIRPLEAELKQSGVSTILYAPDGQLRYIPLTALNDGKQYLIEKWRVNNITATSLIQGDDAPSQNSPRILAGAYTDPSLIRTQGSDQYKGLQFTGPEVQYLTNGLSNTTALLNQKLTQDNLKPELPIHNILHLATHAAFVPGDPSQSYIVFGDGDNPTLRDIATWRLGGIDLVVLSACETGVGGKFGTGAEILGLGYQFQTSGAKATIASLWKIDDGGTQALMEAFYTALKQPGMGKAAALQKAQIALIQGKVAQGSGSARATMEQSSETRSTPKGNSPQNLSHPHYWAPFILIGNGL
jgi:CHAT domain-containing protein